MTQAELLKALMEGLDALRSDFRDDCKKLSALRRNQ